MTDLGITYEEANPPEPYCKRCGKKLGTEAHDVHTCTPKEKVWVGMTDDDVEYAIAAIYKGFDINPRNQIEIDYLSRVIKTVEAKLKEKNT